MATPHRISGMEKWIPGSGEDPAAYLVNPGSVKAAGKASAGNLAHARPYLVSGKQIFVFPVGVEGFRRSGQAQLGLHHFIGDNAVVGITVHREEARIELSGTFPGITAQANMVACINVLRSGPVGNGLVLYAPGVFNMEQYVLAESWDFTHDEADRTHSIGYTISLVRTGEGGKVTDPTGSKPPQQPAKSTTPKGKATRQFIVKDNARTLRAIAKAVYGNTNQWQLLVNLNRALVAQQGIPQHTLPTYRWAIGTKFNY